MLHARDDYNRIQDPWGAIPADEPVFLIRGQDALGARALRLYAQLVEMENGPRDIIDATLAQADRMDTWPRKKMPDMPEAPPTIGDGAATTGA